MIVAFSKHAEERLVERDVSSYEATSLILKLGERILDMKNGEEFGVIDKELEIGLVCSINTIGLDVFVDVVTVLQGEMIYFSHGIKILEFKKIWDKVS